MKRISYFIFAIFLLVLTSFAQKIVERESHTNMLSASNVKSLIINANKIKTILYNTGSISNPGVLGNVLDFTWNGLGYAYEIGFMVGAKVQKNNSTDSIAIISEGFGVANKSTADGDFSSDGITKWGFTPTNNLGDTNSTLIANNQDPSTWDPSWVKWQGKYGDAIADMELAYEMNDYSNAEFDYYPFPDDTLKRGLGITVESRVYQFAHPNLEDALFNTFEISNNSQKKLEHMVAGIFGDPHIGGPNNYNDDASDFDAEHQFFYSWDPNNDSDIPAIAPGYFGWTLYDTPSNKGITSLALFTFGGYSKPKNDTLMYNYLSEGNFKTDFFYSKDTALNIGDFINTMGSGFFALEPGQKSNLTVVYLLGYDLQDLLTKSTVVKQHYEFKFGQPGEPITLTSPTAEQRIQTSIVQIQWSAQTLDSDTTVDLYYSNTPGEIWNKIALNIPNTGSYQWNVTSLPDGAFYKIHLLQKKNNTISYDTTGGYFYIDHADLAPPEITILYPKNVKEVSDTIPLQWVARDAEGDPINIKIYFSDNEGLTYQFVNEVNNTGFYSFNTRLFPNTHAAKIKLTAVSNGIETSIETKTFRVSNFFNAITDTTSLHHVAGTATGGIFPGIADSTALTGDKYRITFDSSAGSLVYTLKNITINQMKLENEPLNGINGSGKLVDGMRIWFQNDPLGLDSLRSGFDEAVPNIFAKYAKPSFGTFRIAPIELQIVFSSLDTNSNGDYLFPMDTVGNIANPFSKIVTAPFTIKNITDTSTIQYFVREYPGSYKMGRWDFGEEIVVLTPIAYRTALGNVHAALTFYKIDKNISASIPNGAIYTARITKPFSTNDIYEFTADAQYGQPTIVQPGISIPEKFILEQNYPNPFNPITHIQFSLPSAKMTTLTVYDIMGREVKRLVSESLSAGSYTFEWDGTNNFSQKVSSGIYFYRLQSGSNASSKKMILLK